MDPAGIPVNACGMRKHSAWIQIAAAVASGLLVAGLFPPFGIGALVWLALVPMLAVLWALDGRRAGWKGFGLGWLAGTLSSLVQFHWLGIVSPLGVVLLPVYLGLFWGLFGAFAATHGNPWRHAQAAPTGRWAVMRGSLRVALCHGAVWAGLEWLRSWLFTGFGWNGLGVALGGTPVMAQAADLLGVTGLAIVPVFFQAVLVQAARRMLQPACAGMPRTRLDLLAALAGLGLLAGYGG